MENWAEAYADWRRNLGIDDLAWNRCLALMQAIEAAPMNLTALSGVGLREKGILDSLTVLTMVNRWNRAMDIGSGAGFPGLVLAIARSDCPMTLVESRKLRAGFLVDTTKVLALTAVTVVQARAESLMRLGGDHRERYDLVTLRAVGSFRLSVELGLAAAEIGGSLVLLRGHGADRECHLNREWVAELGGRIDAVEATGLPSSAGEVRCLVRIRKIEKTPIQFPRGRHLGD